MHKTNINIPTESTLYDHPMLNRHVLIRTYSSGVHIGILKSIDYSLAGTEVILENSHRLWYWTGAFTLSAVSQDGIGKDSRISRNIPVHCIQNVIEIIPTTEKARLTYEKYFE